MSLPGLLALVLVPQLLCAAEPSRMSVVASDPGSGRVDAREDRTAGGSSAGIAGIYVGVSEPVVNHDFTSPTASSFQFRYYRNGAFLTGPELGPAGEPQVTMQPTTYPHENFQLYVTPHIPSGVWTEVRLNTLVGRWGYFPTKYGDVDRVVVGSLPMDTNSSGHVSADDVHRLLGCVAAPPPAPQGDSLLSCDMNRDNVISAGDLVRGRELLQGANSSRAWAGYSMGAPPPPSCPSQRYCDSDGQMVIAPPVDLPLSEGSITSTQRPVVLPEGDGWIVFAVRDNRSCAVSGGLVVCTRINASIVATRLDSRGVVITHNEIIGTGPGVSTVAAVALPDGYLLGWRDDDQAGQPGLATARIDSALNVLHRDFLVTNLPKLVKVSGGNGHYGIFWEWHDPHQNYYYAPLDELGNIGSVIKLRNVIQYTHRLSQTVAWNGSNYAIAHENDRLAGINVEMFVLTVSPEGSITNHVLLSEGVETGMNSRSQVRIRPRADGGFDIGWISGAYAGVMNDIAFVRVDANGNKLGPVKRVTFDGAAVKKIGFDMSPLPGGGYAMLLAEQVPNQPVTYVASARLLRTDGFGNVVDSRTVVRPNYELDGCHHHNMLDTTEPGYPWERPWCIHSLGFSYAAVAGGLDRSLAVWLTQVPQWYYPGTTTGPLVFGWVDIGRVIEW